MVCTIVRDGAVGDGEVKAGLENGCIASVAVDTNPYGKGGAVAAGRHAESGHCERARDRRERALYSTVSVSHTPARLTRTVEQRLAEGYESYTAPAAPEES